MQATSLMNRYRYTWSIMYFVVLQDQQNKETCNKATSLMNRHRYTWSVMYLGVLQDHQYKVTCNKATSLMNRYSYTGKLCTWLYYRTTKTSRYPNLFRSCLVILSNSLCNSHLYHLCIHTNCYRAISFLTFNKLKTPLMS